MPRNPKPHPKPTPYDKPATRKSSRQSKKATDIADNAETFSTNTVFADDQMPGPSNVIDTNSVNVNSNSVNNTEVVTRSEFVQLQNNVDKILLSLNQLHASQNAVSSFPIGRANQNVQPSNEGNSVTLTQEVDTSGMNMNPQLDEVNLDVQHAVSQGLEKILHPAPSNSGENVALNLPGRPIDLQVSNKIKQQIWANEFVELSALIDIKNDETTSYHMVSEGGTISIAPNKSAKKIAGLGQWCSAFMVYITIYCKKFPEELSDLTTYMATIKRLCHRGGGLFNL